MEKKRRLPPINYKECVKNIEAMAEVLQLNVSDEAGVFVIDDEDRESEDERQIESSLEIEIPCDYAAIEAEANSASPDCVTTAQDSMVAADKIAEKLNTEIENVVMPGGSEVDCIVNGGESKTDNEKRRSGEEVGNMQFDESFARQFGFITNVSGICRAKRKRRKIIVLQ